VPLLICVGPRQRTRFRQLLKLRSLPPPILAWAEHLRGAGDERALARRITEANLHICERERWECLISMCQRLLGDLRAPSRRQRGRGGARPL
jgi:hypothetical protein